MDQQKMKNHSDTISGAVVMAFIAVLVMSIFNIRLPISVTTSTTSSELAVIGEGKVDIVPDVAYVDLGISVSGITSVQEAQNKIDSVNNAVLQAVEKLGISKNNVKTTNYSINPNYVYSGGRDQINGYNGNATITVKTNKTDLVPTIIQTATAAGANQVQGARFSIEKPENYRAKARNKAITNAKEQAQSLASDLGIKLGKITNIIESTSANGGPMMEMVKALPIGGATGGPTIEPGMQTISSVVTLYFQKN